eukprot:6472467-Amphidinium_carterae.2
MPIEIVGGQQTSTPMEQSQWNKPQQNYQPQKAEPAQHTYGPWQGTQNWGSRSGAELQGWKTPQQNQNNYWNNNAQWNQQGSNAASKDKNAGGYGYQKNKSGMQRIRRLLPHARNPRETPDAEFMIDDQCNSMYRDLSALQDFPRGLLTSCMDHGCHLQFGEADWYEKST